MKKIYLKPEVQNTAINSKWAMCSQNHSYQDNEQTGNPGASGPPMPGKLF